MASARFSFAIETGALEVPDTERFAFLEPNPDSHFSDISAAEILIQSTFRPFFDVFVSQGLSVSEKLECDVDIVHVTVPRSRDFARGLVAQAERLVGNGLVLVDGAKTDGVDSLLKAIRTRVQIEGQVSKAHGRMFWFRPAGAFTDWALPDPAPVSGGWITQPGVFSADGPDAGSEALVAALPKSLKGRGADLGGGWGYLTRHLLDVPGVTGIDLVEADKHALDCAALNVSDEKVVFHWADATVWGAPKTLDWVVMNPPFHTSRTPDASLGQAFIRSAARLLKPKGQLVMVANRHLPYESTLAACFGSVQELDGDSRFKILQADHPIPPERAGRTRRR
jgi:16S rRNA (guanine1207-N2)-methyltransferase